MGKRAGRSLEIDPEVRQAETPEEAGGEGSASLFDFSGDARIRVLRRDDRTQKFTTHGFFPVTAKEEDISNEFGGGRYRCQLIVPDGTGREVIKTQREFDIPGAYRPPMGDLPGLGSRSAVHSASPVPTPTMPGMSDLGQMFNATMITAFMDMVKTMKEVSSRPTPTTDPVLLKMMESQANVQAKLIELMLSRGDALKGDSKKEILELLTSMKELIGPQQQPIAADPNKTLESIVGAIKQLRDVSDEFRPDTGSGDPLLDSLPKLVEVVAEEHQMRKQAALNPTQRTEARRVPSPGTQPSLPVEGPLWKRVLEREAPRLIASARAGRDPETIARIAVEFAPAQIKGAITEFFHRETDEVLSQLLSEIPALAEQPQWMREFVENVQILLFPDEFEETEDEATEVTEGSEDTPTKE